MLIPHKIYKLLYLCLPCGSLTTKQLQNYIYFDEKRENYRKVERQVCTLLKSIPKLQQIILQI
jgi:hypothetical protein